jgi:uncharacterized membrane protein YeaQ/YmgE (transglycosylase-associated protein family)
LYHENQGFYMSLIGWIVLGFISGFSAGKVVNNSGEGVFLDIELAIVGAFLGGWRQQSELGRGRHRRGHFPAD